MKVATPLTAAPGVAPLSVDPPGLLPGAILTLPVKLGTGFPSASSARTFTAGLIWWCATVVLGSVLNASCVEAAVVSSLVLFAARAGRCELASRHQLVHGGFMGIADMIVTS